MYESIQVKGIPETEWTCIVELVKQSNLNDRFGNVNHSGIFVCIFTLLAGTLHTKDHVDLILIASNANDTLHQLDHGDLAVQCAQLGMVMMGGNND